MTDIRWLARVNTSAWHWIACQTQYKGEVNNSTLTSLYSTWNTWQQFIAAEPVDSELALQTIVPLSAEFDNTNGLAESVIAKLFPRDKSPLLLSRWSRQLAAVQRDFLVAFPKLQDELSLRINPIRELFEAQGPGLLKAVGRLSDEQLVPEAAKIVIVQPVLGGHGTAYPLNNTVVWEGMLANPCQMLPEVVRLAWLISQLNFELPALLGELPRDRAIKSGAWAAVPLVLSACEELEFLKVNPSIMQLAATTWHLVPPRPNLSIESCVATIAAWWETYQNMKPAWPVAIAALDKMWEAK